MTKYRNGHNGRNGPQRTATGFRCGSVVAYSVAVFRHTHTNNAVEGWHNRFHKAVRMDHPNIYLFVMHLRREQHKLLINLNQAALGYSQNTTEIQSEISK